MNRSESEIVALGAFAEAIVSNHYFSEMTREFQDAAFSSALATEPHEVKKREGIYAQMRGAASFIQHLTDYAAAKAAIVNKDSQPNHDIVDDAE